MSSTRVPSGPKSLLTELDAIRGGELSARIRGYREEGRTFDEIAILLSTERIVVSREAVRRFWNKLNAA